MKQLVYVLFLFTILGLLIYFGTTRRPHKKTHPIIEDLKTTLSPVHPIIKTLNISEGDQAKTINKERIVLCLKDKDGVYYDKNMLVYVLIHETAHMLCPEYSGHNKHFYSIMNKLLDTAIIMKLFDPTKPLDPNYCVD